MTFAEYSTKWLSEQASKTAATQDTFRSHIRKVSTLLGDKQMGELTYPILKEFIQTLSVSLGSKTIRNIWSTLRIVLGEAKREGILNEIPELFLPKLPRRHNQRMYSFNELRKIVNTKDPILAILAETGVRVGELMGLQYEDLDMIMGTIKISHSMYKCKLQDTKTPASDRTICMSHNLHNLLAGQPWPLFKTKEPNRLAKQLTRRLPPGIEWKGFHAFRRGNATLMAMLGVPIKIAAGRLGHELPGLTFGLYAQVVDEADRKWVAKLGDCLWKKKTPLPV